MTNYNDLKTAIAVYLGWDAGGEINSYLPTIIRMAEVRIQRDAELRVMERTGYTDTVAGESDYVLPNKRVDGDWDVYMSMRDVCLEGNPNINLVYGTPEIFSDYSSQTGEPKVYTVVGRTLRLAPKPDRVYRILLTYYAQIPPLSDNQPANDVLLEYPDLYLYASLVEAVSLLRSSVPVEEWLAKYTNSLQMAIYNDEKSRFTRNIAARPPRAATRL